MGGPESKCIADCPETQKLETPTNKRFLLLPAELKFPMFLGGDTRQATRGARRWSWIKKTWIVIHIENIL
ncbi:hypothetical protein G3A_19825 [Bacillus sp. 17376]|nr:hypothetical protein G3A_19825 [Bacillus sp. 17376]